MGRRSHSRQSIETELFPFLSVLACTIGTMILLIIVLTMQLFTTQREVTIVAKSETGEMGKNRNKTPRYIECRQDGVIIHQVSQKNNSQSSQQFVAKKNLENQNSALIKLINEVKAKRDREYVIVALRPDGLEVFQKVRALIEKEEIDIGYEPVEKDWKLKINN
jgi:biopolymer transport protein ExbD